LRPGVRSRGYLFGSSMIGALIGQERHRPRLCLSGGGCGGPWSVRCVVGHPACRWGATERPAAPGGAGWRLSVPWSGSWED